MGNTSGICPTCEKPKTTNTGKRCSECVVQSRKIAVRRYSEPPTPQSTPCRVWQGPVNHAGYGQNGRKGRVHRWVWESVYGPIPDGMVVMHKCDNRPCFRLDHLQLGTQAENAADMARKKRMPVIWTDPSWLYKRGQDHAQAKLDERKVAEIKALFGTGLVDREIAERFGVSRGHILSIRHGKVWAWVEPASS
jgi:hypothetical protein